MTENQSSENAPHRESPLESWKEIAAYLKRDVSTLKRWEKSEGLPVRRHRHRPSRDLGAADRRGEGAPVLVHSEVPLYRPMGLTRQGALYYGVRTGFSDVYVAALDKVTGAVLSAPAPLSPRFVGWNRSPDWSTDGRSVAYASQRQSAPRSLGWMGGVIVVRSLGSGEEREITPRLAPVGPAGSHVSRRAILPRPRPGHEGPGRHLLGERRDGRAQAARGARASGLRPVSRECAPGGRAAWIPSG